MNNYAAVGGTNPPNTKKFSFDFLFFKRLFSLLRVQFDRWMWLIFILFLLSSIAQVWVVSFTGSVNGGFAQLILTKDTANFRFLLIKAILVVIGSSLLDAIIKMLVEWFQWKSRQTVCQKLHAKYFENRHYYKINCLDTELLDNPDQRITQDVEAYTIALGSVLKSIATAPLIIGFYTYKSWTVIGWFAPCIILGYFTFGYILNKFIMSPIARLVFNQERLEGNFRYSHMRVRTSAESIALYRGETQEHQHAQSSFFEVLQNMKKLIGWHFLLNLSSDFFSYCAAVLNYVIVALPFLFLDPNQPAPNAEFVGSASFLCLMLVYGFSQFINVSQPLSDLAGLTARVAGMLERMEDWSKNNENDKSLVVIDSEMENSEEISFENVSCFTPNGIPLFKNLSFSVKKNQNLLIMGPSGSGKTSIVRALSGLWPFFQGNILRPSPKELFYLPQKPYLFTGTLAEQIFYPTNPNPNPNPNPQNPTFSASKLLETIGLKHLESFYGLFTVANWSEMLSPGEQQLISFARLFFHKPKYAVLDEATSALPAKVEKEMYGVCEEMGITVVSVGHRLSLLPFHRNILELDVDHSWTLKSLKEENVKLE